MAQNHTNSESDHVEHHDGHVIVPYKTLRNVAITLLCLTVLTVATAQLHLGWAAAPIAFLIAFIKAMLVMMYFMGLKFDSVLNRVIFACGFFFLAVFYIFCALDAFTRVKEISTL
jgi:cytochrome c oxidase subunit 4